MNLTVEKRWVSLRSTHRVGAHPARSAGLEG
jgi:hypothetical protein